MTSPATFFSTETGLDTVTWNRSQKPSSSTLPLSAKHPKKLIFPDKMVSQHVVKLCQEVETVSSILESNPRERLHKIVERLFGHHSRDLHADPETYREPPSSETLDAAFKCGRWGGTRPSPLFLQAFADAVNCLGPDALSGIVSPPLMGTHGTIPLTVIAPLGDVIRHCSNLIVRAEKEVLFITCSWSPSVAQRLIRNALVELSRRAGERGQRVLVKLMYDKVMPGSAIDPHQVVSPSNWNSKSLQLPSPEEIPNLDMEVMGYHKIALGTLHSKFCVIDRKVAIVMSNNIEDNANMEMMTHLEGPIVDSIYDTALITWNKSFNPPLAQYKELVPDVTAPDLGQEPLYLRRGPSRLQGDIVVEGEAHSDLQEHTTDDPHYDDNLTGEILRMQSCYSTKDTETRLQAANRQLNLAVKSPIDPSGPDIPDGQEMVPFVGTSTTQTVPIAMVSRSPYGRFDSKNVYVPQNEAWLSLIRNAQKSIFIQTPDLNAAPLLPAIVEALKRGVEVTYYVCFGYNDAGEIIPGQGGTNEQAAQALLASLPAEGSERLLLNIYDYVAKDQDHPIHQQFRSRTCHIKLLVADGAVGIQGSGNQDTQSWFHSQELNIMVDSEEICQKWRECIERNQNTKAFGRVAEDGVWRDAAGKPGDGYMGNPGNVEGLFKGVTGMMKKAGILK